MTAYAPAVTAAAPACVAANPRCAAAPPRLAPSGGDAWKDELLGDSEEGEHTQLAGVDDDGGDLDPVAAEKAAASSGPTRRAGFPYAA